MKEEFTEDPMRWREGGAPDGALALLAALEEPPPLPTMVRRKVGDAVRAETGSGRGIPWAPLLLMAAVTLLAFMAGWLWSGSDQPPDQPSIAAPFGPEESSPAETPNPPEPSPSTMAEPSPAMAAEPTPEPTAERERPAERRQRRRRARPAPDLVDPFAAMEASAMRTPSREPRVIDPFAPRGAPTAGSGGVTANPFTGVEGDAAPATMAGTGRLSLNTVPWSRVFLDGEDTGRNTPVMQMRVSAGRHRVGFRTSDGTMHTVTVTIEAGETLRLYRHLQ